MYRRFGSALLAVITAAYCRVEEHAPERAENTQR